MASQTVKQFAETLKVDVDRLLTQLKQAGVNVTDPNGSITEEQKTKLLTFLRSTHGKDTSKRVTITRRSNSEAKAVGSDGKAKSVSVTTRKRRTFVSRTELEAEAEAEKLKTAEKAPVAEAAPEQKDTAATEKEVAAVDNTAAEKAAAEKAAAEKAAADKAAAEKAAAEKAAAEKAAKEAPAKAKTEADKPRTAKAPPRNENKPAANRGNTNNRGGGNTNNNNNRGGGNNRGGNGGRGGNNGGRGGNNRGRNGGRGGRGGRRGQPQVQVDNQHTFEKPTAPVVREVEISETITVGELAQRMAVKATEVIKVMMSMGAMVTINQVIDQDTATLVVEEMGHTVKLVSDDFEAEALAPTTTADDSDNTEVRPPVITVMGHVDHGKTSLLDYIRTSRVTAGEAGGITQHVGAYHVETDKGVITFLDTPGHAAFSQMRARGASLTDIVILVVAADDGVMPQTVEAINHAKQADVPLIIAVNKMDKPEANPDQVKNELSQHEIIPEDWGGEHQFVEVSAKTGNGVDDLLEAIQLQAEVLELKANSSRQASGVVIESSLEKGRGAVATVLVQNGTLNQGDIILCGEQYGRVRAMFDEDGNPAKSAGPSIPVVILGLSGVPNSGDDAIVLDNERKAREVAEHRQTKLREEERARQQAAKLENLFQQMADGKLETVNLMVKADVHGSAEALKESLLKLSNDEVRVKVISSGVGGLNETDINLAHAAGAIVIGFNVRADSSARKLIQEHGVDVHYHSIIYEAIEVVKKAILGLMTPEMREQILGIAEVRDVFRSSELGAIAGCLVTEGTIKKANPIRVLRDNVVVFEGELESLRRFKDAVNEVKSGVECGIGVAQYNDIQPGDQIEVFERVEIAPTLK